MKDCNRSSVSCASPRSPADLIRLKRGLRLGMAVLIPLVLLAVAIVLLGGLPRIARAAGPLFVAPGAACGGPTPCFGDIQAAVNAAAAGDEILVAAGTYTSLDTTGGHTETVFLNKSVTLRGGYTTTNWTASDPQANPTVIDPQGQGRGVYVGSGISATVEGF
ncbi:MAG: hypothetical protein ACE5H9_17475, partial [Anaerolineae bacterium]